MAKGNGSGLSSSMKAVGRGMAKANLQKSGQKFASGGAIKPKMGDFGGRGIDPSPTGAGKARGGKASRGMNFRGSF